MKEDKSMEFKELAEKRYSCRKFSNQKVEQHLLDQIIDTAIKAPTAVNTQPYKIFCMDSTEAKENIHKVTPFTFGADTFLVIGYKEDSGWVRSFDNRNFSDVDCSIVATHIMMEICDLGLATTWVGHFDAPLLKQMYPAMKDYNLIAIFPIGYAAEDDQPSPKHYKRKTKKEVFEML